MMTALDEKISPVGNDLVLEHREFDSTASPGSPAEYEEERPKLSMQTKLAIFVSYSSHVILLQ